jgi:hypothetical protein
MPNELGGFSPNFFGISIATFRCPINVAGDTLGESFTDAF